MRATVADYFAAVVALLEDLLGSGADRVSRYVKHAN